MKESIAVIIPSYNYGGLVGSAIDSVLAQTLRPAEILVVDDGSTDDTPQVVRRYKDVRYVWKPNAGPASARNLGLRQSTSSHVIFLDADDVLRPNALETLWGALQKAGPEVRAVFARTEKFSGSAPPAGGKPDYMPRPEDIRPYVSREIAPDIKVLSREIVRRIVRSGIVPQCSALVARSVYEKVGQWDEGLRSVEDRDMWLRIASRCTLAYVDCTVADVRVHENNLSHRKNWIANYFNILALLEKASSAQWAEPLLRRLAKRRYATGACYLAQRLADEHRYAEAARLTRAALRRDPLRPKTWVRMLQYSLKRSARRGRRHPEV